MKRSANRQVGELPAGEIFLFASFAFYSTGVGISDLSGKQLQFN
jgi:hypothetical protein